VSLSLEHRAKISRAMIGRRPSPQACRAARLALLGKPGCWAGKKRPAQSELMRRLWCRRAFRRAWTAASRNFWKSLDYDKRLLVNQIGRDVAARANPSSFELFVRATLRDLKIAFKVAVRFGRYVVDIYVARRRLVVECDGEYWHRGADRQRRDRERDRWFKARGYRVLRIPEVVYRRRPLAEARVDLTKLLRRGLCPLL